MRRPTTSRVPSRAAMLLLSAFPLLACDDGTDTVAPRKAAAAQASIVDVPGARHDILHLVDIATASWAAKDAAGYASIYATEAQVVTPIGSLLVGREGVRAQHAFLFGGPFAGSTQSIMVRDLVFLTGTIALVMQDVSLTGYAFLPPGLPSTGGVVRTRVTWVVEKRGATWEIVFQQMTPQP